MSKVDIVSIYSQYMEAKQKENTEKRYKGKERYYHGSGAGTCSRKLYYQSVERAKETNKPTERGNRIMRLGTIVHEDFEKAFSLYNNNIYNKLIYRNSNKKENNIKEKQIEFLFENEVIVEDLNVRGFYDLVAKCGDEVYLYDLKTMGSWPWKSKIANDGTGSETHHLQLATYGLAIKEEFGRLDGMFLYYYNKDPSMMRAGSVPLTYISRAYLFWKNVIDEHKQGLPPFRIGVSPVQDWQCNYCQFLDHCNPQR